MNKKQLLRINATLRTKSPLEIIQWAIQQAGSKGAVVSTNYRPFESVVLHAVTQAQADIPVLWVDHGYNRPATYRHAEELNKLLDLNVKAYVPKITSAHRDAIEGAIPTIEDELALKNFSAVFKLEPFQRGLKELQPSVWITGLRKEQSPAREELDIVTEDNNFGVLKVSPFFYFTTGQMGEYVREYNLPNEWDYIDPAKADEKRECGLHATWAGEILEKK